MTDTRIYTACVDCLRDPVLYQEALTLLPPQRAEQARRMKPESGKRLSAGAGLLLMASLAEVLPELRINPVRSLRTVRFAQGAHGKPYLQDFPGVHFNLSHSGSRVMCIVSAFECGCDVERVSRNSKQIDMVIRCLAESEQRLAAVSAVSFCRIWTLKESILKLSGRGLSIPLNSFEVMLDPLSVRQDFLPESFVMKEYDAFRGVDCQAPSAAGMKDDSADSVSSAGDQYCCACAAAGGSLPDEMVEVDLKRVLAWK